MQNNKQPASGKAKNQTVPMPADFAQLRQRADRGEPEAQAELKAWLDANPTVWRRLGDLAHHAQMEFVRLVTKGDFLFSESIRRRADEMRHELAGTFPTPLEILAVERVVAAWLQVQYVEGQIALGDAELPKAKFWLQRQLQANRLYHAATKSLLLIRELLPPAAEPVALAAHGTAIATLNGTSRLAVCVNGDRSSHKRTPAAEPVSRTNSTVRNGRHREVATT
jgi:hypothetical protein